VQQQSATAAVQRHSQQLVLVRSVEAAAADAAADPAAGACNSVAALQWLLRQPGITAPAVNRCAQQLLAIRCVPFAAARALVEAGLRMQITWQQLVQAAYSCVEGLEVWVAAFDSAGVPQQEWAADMPPGMVHVCCTRQGPQLVRAQHVSQHRTSLVDCSAVQSGVDTSCSAMQSTLSDLKCASTLLF
jgi:hypothetical protein